MKETDPRRFERVRRRLKWIVHDPPIYGVAEYQHNIRACNVKLWEPSPDYRRESLVAWYARILVHEATHGEIAAHGIRYTNDFRVRIERLCVREEQRFLVRLGQTQPELATWLHREFDPSMWAQSWAAMGTQQFVAKLKQIYQEYKSV